MSSLVSNHADAPLRAIIWHGQARNRHPSPVPNPAAKCAFPDLMQKISEFRLLLSSGLYFLLVPLASACPIFLAFALSAGAFGFLTYEVNERRDRHDRAFRAQLAALGKPGAE